MKFKFNWASCILFGRKTDLGSRRTWFELHILWHLHIASVEAPSLWTHGYTVIQTCLMEQPKDAEASRSRALGIMRCWYGAALLPLRGPWGSSCLLPHSEVSSSQWVEQRLAIAQQCGNYDYFADIIFWIFFLLSPEESKMYKLETGCWPLAVCWSEFHDRLKAV